MTYEPIITFGLWKKGNTHTADEIITLDAEMLINTLRGDKKLPFENQVEPEDSIEIVRFSFE